jgi:hypothetical protein
VYITILSDFVRKINTELGKKYEKMPPLLGRHFGENDEGSAKTLLCVVAVDSGGLGQFGHGAGAGGLGFAVQAD